jgi:hypothetical protein
MQHSGAADGPVSSTVSQHHAGCKHKSGSLGVVVRTGPVGAKRARRPPGACLVAVSLRLCDAGFAGDRIPSRLEASSQ